MPYRRHSGWVHQLPSRSRGLILSVAILLAASAHAQGRPGGGGPGGPGGGGFGGMGGGGGRGGGNLGDSGNRSSFPGTSTHTWPSSSPNSSGTAEPSISGSTLRLGPAGRWWNNKDFAQSLRIDSGQQRRMDEVFTGNRDTLLKLYKNLQHEESQLGKTIRTKELDEREIFAGIDRVTQARAELEKANAHLLLQLRKELTPDQTAKLDESRPAS